MIAQRLFPHFMWSVPTKDKQIFITFDDGPIPKVTPWVVDQLNQFDAKATFFMVGENVFNNQQEYLQVKEEGHRIGNHTYNHVNGWETPFSEYLRNIDQCDEAMGSESVHFRPPYGKISKRQRKELLKTKVVVMWDVLSADFDPRISGETCLSKTIRATDPGSIVLFHDSVKSEKRVRYALPRFLDHFSNKGYQFKSLPL